MTAFYKVHLLVKQKHIYYIALGKKVRKKLKCKETEVNLHKMGNEDKEGKNSTVRNPEINGKCLNQKKGNGLKVKEGKILINCDYCAALYCFECYEFSTTKMRALGL